MRLFVGILVGASLLAPRMHAQITAPSSLGVWLSGARGGRIETRGGVRHDRSLGTLGLRAAWRLSPSAPIELEYTADLMPLILATGNRAYRWEGACSGQGGPCNGALLRVAFPYSTIGAGFAPLGLQFRSRLTPTLALVGGGSAGVLYFARAVPDHEAARLNFMGEGGGGVELTLRPKRVLTVGYRFQHVSNAGIAPINVGMNTHLVVVGLVVPR